MSGARPSPLPRINLLTSALDLQREVLVIRSALERQIERLDGLEKEIRIIVAVLREALKAPHPEAGALPPLTAAHSFITSRLADDSAEIRVDGGEAFRLPPLLAGLVDFLAMEGQASGAQFAGWKSREEIQMWLAVKSSKKVRRQYVNNLVSRLRMRFTDAHVDAAVIQTHRRKGVRLAAKRFAAPVMEGDS